MKEKEISNPCISPTDFAAVMAETGNTLRYMAECGSRGFDCSRKTLELLKNLGTRKKPETETLASIYADLENCRRCKLCTKRTKIVFGAGSPNARLIFVGEGPGYDEDLSGEPFVGKAGQLLTKIIKAMNLTREQVYICNIVKCRPPGNRNPEPDEIMTCIPFLKKQIAVIKPEFICALGKIAAQALLNSTQPISKIRGSFFDYQGIKLMPTFHPAFLLRNPAKKGDVWEDMKKIMREMGQKI
ncbi:Uracil DNA glycolyase superfamily protein [Desulfonema limicola]|uniref:Type-4 uracil-DNA glycosylase n=1 Tax=Desulfonema limicola TaxID=45656 RepID=A0A975B819_9BACT|nr:uracil-DNA glycosylase [Desulfonema limicola]QTA80285.1 Uracil DNA glycolyase superfamily protein [Desulfonema limicola]